MIVTYLRTRYRLNVPCFGKADIVVPVRLKKIGFPCRIIQEINIIPWSHVYVKLMHLSLFIIEDRIIKIAS